MLPTFKSRIALWAIRLAIVIPAVLCLGMVVFELGGCTIGLTMPGDCQHIPQDVGQIAFLIGAAGYILGSTAAPLIVIIAGLAEIFTRNR